MTYNHVARETYILEEILVSLSCLENKAAK